MSKLLDQLISETGIELHSSRYDVAAAMIERELQAKWDAGYAAAIAQDAYGDGTEPTRIPISGGDKFISDLNAVAAEQKAKEATE